MKGRAIVLEATAVLLSVFLFEGCLTAKKTANDVQDWTVVGSWINKSYDNRDYVPAREVYGHDGTLSYYQHLKDKTPNDAHYPIATGTYSIESSWIEGDVYWFKIRCTFGDEIVYELVKLTESGNTFESVLSMGGNYPAAFVPSEEEDYYTVRHRE